MIIKKITDKGTYTELIVEMSVFGEIKEATFIATKDVGLSTKMCDACPLHQDCFIEDTLKYELCCFLELAYQTPLPNVDLGVLYIKPESALSIKKIIDEKLGRGKKELEDNIEEKKKDQKESENINEEPQWKKQPDFICL